MNINLQDIAFLMMTALAVGMCILSIINKRRLMRTEFDLQRMLSMKKSSEVRLGQISENLAPFLKDFKYDPKKAHFIGMPIDYIIFDDEKITFLEVKSGESALSKTQRNIKKLVKAGKVEWDEMRIR